MADRDKPAKEQKYAVTYGGPKGVITPGAHEFIIAGELLDHKDDTTLVKGVPQEVSKTVFEKLQSIAHDYRATEEFSFDDDYTPPEPKRKATAPAEGEVTEDRGINEPGFGVADVVGDSEPPGEKQAVEGSGVAARSDTDSDR